MSIDVHHIRHHAEDNPWVRQLVEEAGLNPFLLDDVSDEDIVAAFARREGTKQMTMLEAIKERLENNYLGLTQALLDNEPGPVGEYWRRVNGGEENDRWDGVRDDLFETFSEAISDALVDAGFEVEDMANRLGSDDVSHEAILTAIGPAYREAIREGEEWMQEVVKAVATGRRAEGWPAKRSLRLVAAPHSP